MRYFLFYIFRYLVNDVLHVSTYFVIFCFDFLCVNSIVSVFGLLTIVMTIILPS